MGNKLLSAYVIAICFATVCAKVVVLLSSVCCFEKRSLQRTGQKKMKRNVEKERKERKEEKEWKSTRKSG